MANILDWLSSLFVFTIGIAAPKARRVSSPFMAVTKGLGPRHNSLRMIR
ncbi:MAG: hypothetical protein O3C52_04065 [Proteobacteria bacterium]|nr:hypothetical protein [Pseudomonadota bacterium]MDA0913594.1 hypothetical protein [Pseudomonadota bacterium]MDA1032535.1 hypothetical protein [Pseudomonadota bacterium]